MAQMRTMKKKAGAGTDTGKRKEKAPHGA